MSDGACDLLVIGGGINGAAVARDAAGRGLRVVLCERGDLAGATSSATSKLIHGGLRYLEQREFRLVREGLRERALLLRGAPHLVQPLRLVLPHDPASRPRWLVRLGLFLYDRLGGARDVPRTAAVDLRADPAGAPLRPGLRHGFAFYDGWTDDARLVLERALEAAERGASILSYTSFERAARADGEWRVELQPRDPATGAARGPVREVRARALANVAGPWVMNVAAALGVPPPRGRVRLVQGIHVVVPRWFEGRHAWLLQNDDGRVVFVLPWQESHVLIGTTDRAVDGAPETARVHPEEVAYLCRAVGRWFARAPRPEEVVHSFVGVRPLFDDGARNPSEVTRDRRLFLDADGPPVLHVMGGKLTTHRALAEDVLDRLAPVLPGTGPRWTAAAAATAAPDAAQLARALQARLPELPDALALGLAQRHGERATAVLGDARTCADLGEHFGAGLTAAEVRWCVRREWARTAADVLERRTRCGFALPPAARASVAALVKAELASLPDRP